MSLENDSRQMYTEVGPEVSLAPVPFSQKRGRRGYPFILIFCMQFQATLCYNLQSLHLLTIVDSSIKGNFQASNLVFQDDISIQPLETLVLFKKRGIGEIFQWFPHGLNHLTLISSDSEDFFFMAKKESSPCPSSVFVVWITSLLRKSCSQIWTQKWRWVEDMLQQHSWLCYTLRTFVFVYLDEFIIFSCSPHEHTLHVHQVLHRPKK